MLGRRRVVGTHDDLNLGENAGGGVLVAADEMEATCALTVKAHDLGERLSDDHFKALAEEKTQTVGILVEGAGGEALVGSVKEGEELVALADIGDLLPLGLSGVDTSRVVSASVEQDTRARLGVAEISDHAVDIEALGCLVEVAVLADFDAGSLQDTIMVAPGRVADVESARPKLGKELTNDAESTSARQSLYAGNVVGTDERAVEAEEDTLGALAELSEAINGEVLLVEGHIGDDSSLSGTDDREDKRLAIVVTVSADTEVNLLRVLVSLEAGGKAKDRISGGHRHVSELIVQGSDSLHIGCVVEIKFIITYHCSWRDKLTRLNQI